MKSLFRTRGFRELEMERVAGLIDSVLTKGDEATIARVRAEVQELTQEFPLYAAPKVRKKARAGR